MPVSQCLVWSDVSSKYMNNVLRGGGHLQHPHASPLPLSTQIKPTLRTTALEHNRLSKEICSLFWYCGSQQLKFRCACILFFSECILWTSLLDNAVAVKNKIIKFWPSAFKDMWCALNSKYDCFRLTSNNLFCLWIIPESVVLTGSNYFFPWHIQEKSPPSS